MDAEFQRQLARFMRLRGIRTKSEAIRLAVRECLERAGPSAARTRYREWKGAALEVALNPAPRFGSDDDLWRSGDGG